jgi:lysophospholipase L1-like esterase
VVFCVNLRVICVVFTGLLASGLAPCPAVFAQTLTSANVQIEWRVENRFRLFREAADFLMHERAWRQYLIHVDGQNLLPAEREKLVNTTSVIGTEHVLNDRFIPFTGHLRSRYDWRGWAAKLHDATCWSEGEQLHSACGGVDAYLNPPSHAVKVWLRQIRPVPLLKELNCEWRVNGQILQTAPCDEEASIAIPYPAGGSVSVNIEGEQPIASDIQVRDLLVVGLGDSFASGEGNPDQPVAFSNTNRTRNIYPKRELAGAQGNAKWQDELCHRSLYSHQLRTALQVAIENPRVAVTFLGYSCSGASIEEGILGPQAYVSYKAAEDGRGNVETHVQYGGKRDFQLYSMLREICLNSPERDNGDWVCPDLAYRRNVDLVLLSVGGNDIGFRNLVTWVALRESASAKLAGLLGTTLSASAFAQNMRDALPGSYAKLARALAAAVPLQGGGLPFDPSHLVLTAYPDILIDEQGEVCTTGNGADGQPEDAYPANQSLDVFSSWLSISTTRISLAHAQLAALHRRMRELAGDHGWTFSSRAYEDQSFRAHGFCARDKSRASDPSEILIMPCWGKAERNTATCEFSLSGKERAWRPYDPRTENYPYALRQRWVRTFNDAYLVVNEKVMNRDGRIQEDASRRVFSETTGAMHPSAEGHAAMADAILVDLRQLVSDLLK